MGRGRGWRDRPSDEVYVQGLVVEGDEPGLNEVHICVGSLDIERLKEGVRTAFQAYILDKHLKRADFGGKVVIVVLLEITPGISDVRHAMEEMERELVAVIGAGKLTTVSGRAVEIHVTYSLGNDG